MKKGSDSNFPIALFCIICSLVSPASCLSEETYRFERMWPALQQPWYFHQPGGIAVDSSGNVYIADEWNHSIKKFTSDGQLITMWGSQGSNSGEFLQPRSVVLDPMGNVFVADTGNNRIQVFTPDGAFIGAWGSSGTENGLFNQPTAIAIDGSGNVCVVDTGNNRIQLFSSDGQFVTAWGSTGAGEGNLNEPQAIAVDGSGNIYIADTGNSRIQKFFPDGQFIAAWGSTGSGDSEFDRPRGVAIDTDSGYLYVADTDNNAVKLFSLDGSFLSMWSDFGCGDGELWGPVAAAVDFTGNVFISELHNNRVQKFTAEGQFISRWQNHGVGEGQFSEPHGIAIDSDGNIYVTDRWAYPVQKFTPDGQFIAAWKTVGIKNGSFIEPFDIAVDSSGSVYVADTGNSRIQKLSPDGQFLTSWGGSGTGKGEFSEPRALTLDAAGNVYVADTGNNRIQKFTSEGRFISSWGSAGSGNGEFNHPDGIAVSPEGDVYVADSYNYRIQKFTSDGTFLSTWGHHGSGDGEFDGESVIAVDSSGNVYVADNVNYRIQKFSPDGQFLATWGSHGSSPGQMDLPGGLALTSDGRVYVADTFNSRVQVFRQAEVTLLNRAVIVAGGGPYAGNNLWEATQMCTNFAYRTLTYQGFTKETICYLTADTGLDLDNNGLADDVDGDTTIDNLEQALTQWAAGADTNDVVLYLSDHGGPETFRISPAETLSADDLDQWLDTLQDSITGMVTVVYDACESGSFIAALQPPPGSDRILITSTAPGESAYFITQGSVSFSNFFWINIFNGLSLLDSFDRTHDAMAVATAYQTPLLDDNGNGSGNDAEDGALARETHIGNGTMIAGDAPSIGSVSPFQTIQATRTANLYADGVIDPDGIARVWAVAGPPGYMQGSADNPVRGLPSCDLAPVGNDRYEASWNVFTVPGTWQVSIYARDVLGNTSVPLLATVVVDEPLTSRAIIVAGGDTADELWPATDRCSQLAYRALTYQGYTDDTICFLSAGTSEAIDDRPSKSALQTAITSWAATEAQDVVLYMVGNGAAETFKLSPQETVAATDLAAWLDSLQETLKGTVTVVYDACLSGSFLPALVPQAGKERIIVSGTAEDEAANFLSDGLVSFSTFFWIRVLNGATLRDAWSHTVNALWQRGQTPRLDANANGIADESEDIRTAMNVTIGTGIMLAGDDPLVGSIVPEQNLDGESSAAIWVEDVSSTGTIERVWAIIVPPGYSHASSADPVTDLETLTLSQRESGRYEASYDAFTRAGTYDITVFAMDEDGNLSLPKQTAVYQEQASTSTTTTTPPADICPAVLLAGGENEKTKVMRTLRDEVLQVYPGGKKYVRLFYRLAPGFTNLLRQDTVLLERCRTALDTLLPVAEALLNVHKKKAYHEASQKQ